MFDLFVSLDQRLDFWVSLQLVVNDLPLDVNGGDFILDEECVFLLMFHLAEQGFRVIGISCCSRLLNILSFENICFHFQHFQVDLLNLLFVFDRPMWIVFIFTGSLDLLHVFANGGLFENFHNWAVVVLFSNVYEAQGCLRDNLVELFVLFLLLSYNLLIFIRFLLLHKIDALCLQFLATVFEASVRFLCYLLAQLQSCILG